MYFQIKKVLRSWIDVSRLDLREVAALPNSIDFFKEYGNIEKYWDVIIMKNINVLQLINLKEDID